MYVIYLQIAYKSFIMLHHHQILDSIQFGFIFIFGIEALFIWAYIWRFWVICG